jgi:hypothetical protein
VVLAEYGSGGVVWILNAEKCRTEFDMTETDGRRDFARFAFFAAARKEILPVL